MTSTNSLTGLRHADRFFIGGEWVAPSSNAMIDVIDSGTEQLFFQIVEQTRPICRVPSRRPATRSTTVRGRG